MSIRLKDDSKINSLTGLCSCLNFEFQLISVDFILIDFLLFFNVNTFVHLLQNCCDKKELELCNKLI